RGISASAPQGASDHALLAQLSDFIIAQAELGEHFLAVFPQMWWRTAVADRGLREFDRVADDGDFARLAIRIAHYSPHAPVQHLWVGEDPVNAVHRSGRHAQFRQALDPFAGRLLLRDRRQYFIKLLTVR